MRTYAMAREFFRAAAARNLSFNVAVFAINKGAAAQCFARGFFAYGSE